ncbi:MAG: hypothetical protein PUP91_22475 [Rhizonema sp. PD37]|nr:hypothetical protein [Rhizonema sp. PD37]
MASNAVLNSASIHIDGLICEKAIASIVGLVYEFLPVKAMRSQEVVSKGIAL